LPAERISFLVESSDFITDIPEHGNVREHETEAGRSPLNVPSVYLVLVYPYSSQFILLNLLKC